MQNQPQQREASRLIQEQRLSQIGMMACAISHDLRQALSAIHANLEFLESNDRFARKQTDLLEIQETVLAMADPIDSLLQFARSGRNNPLVHECIPYVVKKAATSVKFHPDGRNVSVTVDALSPAKAVIDPRNLESAIYNLLLNACQAAARSTHLPEVKIQATEGDEQIYVTVADNGPGVPVYVRKTLFDTFVTAGKLGCDYVKPDGTGGITLSPLF